MKCTECGMEIPLGEGFCPNCGSMVRMMESDMHAQKINVSTPDNVKHNASTYINNERVKKIGIAGAFLVIIILIIYGVIALVGNIKENRATEAEQTEQDISADVAAEEAILGYWESSSGVRVNAMMRNILEENNIPDGVTNLIIGALNISDKDVKLALYFKDNNTVRIALNGNMIGDESLITYEVVGNSRLIIKCPGTKLADLSNLKAGFGGATVEGIGLKDLETMDIAHTFEYSIEENEMKLKVFDEKVRFEKIE